MSDQVTDLQNEIISLLRTLEEIKRMNSLGKTKEIADQIETILNHYNR